MNGFELVVGDPSQARQGAGSSTVRVEVRFAEQQGRRVVVSGRTLLVRTQDDLGTPLRMIPFLGETEAEAKDAVTELVKKLRSRARMDPVYNTEVLSKNGVIGPVVSSTWTPSWLDTTFQSRDYYTVFGQWKRRVVDKHGEGYLLELIALNLPGLEKLDAHRSGLVTKKGKKVPKRMYYWAIQAFIVLNWLSGPVQSDQHPLGVGLTARDAPNFSLADLRDAYAEQLVHWMIHIHDGVVLEPRNLHTMINSSSDAEGLGGYWTPVTPPHADYPVRQKMRARAVTDASRIQLHQAFMRITGRLNGSIQFLSLRSSWYERGSGEKITVTAQRGHPRNAIARGGPPRAAIAQVNPVPPDPAVLIDGKLPERDSASSKAHNPQDFKSLHDDAIQAGESVGDNILFPQYVTPIGDRDIDRLGRVVVSFQVVTPYVFAKDPLSTWSNIIIPHDYNKTSDLKPVEVAESLRRWLNEASMSDGLPLIHVYRIKRILPLYLSGKLPKELWEEKDEKRPALIQCNSEAAHKFKSDLYGRFRNKVKLEVTWNGVSFKSVTVWLSRLRALFRPIWDSDLAGVGHLLRRTKVGVENLSPEWPAPKWFPPNASDRSILEVVRDWDVYAFVCPCCFRRCYTPAPGPPPLNEPWLCGFDYCTVAGPLNKQAKYLRVSRKAMQTYKLESIGGSNSEYPGMQLRSSIIRDQAPTVVRMSNIDKIGFKSLQDMGQRISAANIPCVAYLELPSRRFGVRNVTTALGLNAVRAAEENDSFNEASEPTFRAIQSDSWRPSGDLSPETAAILPAFQKQFKLYKDRVIASLHLSPGLRTASGLLEGARSTLHHLRRFEYTEQEILLASVLHGGALNPLVIAGPNALTKFVKQPSPGNPVDHHGERTHVFLGAYEDGLADHVILPSRYSDIRDMMSWEAVQRDYERTVHTMAVEMEQKDTRVGSFSDLLSETGRKEKHEMYMKQARERLEQQGKSPRGPLVYKRSTVDTKAVKASYGILDQTLGMSVALYGGGKSLLPYPESFNALSLYVSNARALCDRQESYRISLNKNTYIGRLPTALEFDAPELVNLGYPQRGYREDSSALINLATSGFEIYWKVTVVVPFRMAAMPLAVIGDFKALQSVAVRGNAYRGYVDAIQFKLDAMTAAYRIPRMHVAHVEPQDAASDVTWNGKTYTSKEALFVTLRRLWQPQMDNPMVQSAARYMWRDQTLFPGAQKPGDLCAYDIFDWSIGICRCACCQELSWAFVPPVKYGRAGLFTPWLCGYTECSLVGKIAHPKRLIFDRLTPLAYEDFSGQAQLAEKPNKKWMLKIHIANARVKTTEGDIRQRVRYLYEALDTTVCGVDNVPYHWSIPLRAPRVAETGTQVLMPGVNRKLFFDGSSKPAMDPVQWYGPQMTPEDAERFRQNGVIRPEARKMMQIMLLRSVNAKAGGILKVLGTTGDGVRNKARAVPKAPSELAWSHLDMRREAYPGWPVIDDAKKDALPGPLMGRARWMDIYDHPMGALNATKNQVVERWSAEIPMTAVRLDDVMHRMSTMNYLMPTGFVDDMLELSDLSELPPMPSIAQDEEEEKKQEEPGGDFFNSLSPLVDLEDDDTVMAPQPVQVDEKQQEPLMPVGDETKLKKVQRRKTGKIQYYSPIQIQEWLRYVWGVETDITPPYARAIESLPPRENIPDEANWRGYTLKDLENVLLGAQKRLKKTSLLKKNVVEYKGELYSASSWNEAFPNNKVAVENSFQRKTRIAINKALERIASGQWPKWTISSKKRNRPTTEPSQKRPAVSVYDPKSSEALPEVPGSPQNTIRVVSLYNPLYPGEPAIVGNIDVWAGYLQQMIDSNNWQLFTFPSSKLEQWQQDLAQLKAGHWPKAWVQDALARENDIRIMGFSPNLEQFLRLRDANSPVFSGSGLGNLGAVWSRFRGSKSSEEETHSYYTISEMIGSNSRNIKGLGSHVDSDTDSDRDSDAPETKDEEQRRLMRNSFSRWLRQMPKNHEGVAPRDVSWKEIQFMGMRKFEPNHHVAILEDRHGRYALLWVSENHDPTYDEHDASFVYPLCFLPSYGAMVKFKRSLKQYYPKRPTTAWASFLDYLTRFSRETPRQHYGPKPTVLPTAGDDTPLQYRVPEDLTRHALASRASYHTLQHHLWWEHSPRVTLSKSGDEAYTYPPDLIAFQGSSVDPREADIHSHVFTSFDRAVESSWRSRINANGIVRVMKTGRELTFWRPTMGNLARLHEHMESIPEEKRTIPVQLIADNPSIESIDPLFAGRASVPIVAVHSIKRVHWLSAVFGYDRVRQGSLYLCEDRPRLLEEFEKTILFPYLKKRGFAGWVVPPRTLLSGARSTHTAHPRLAMCWDSPGKPQDRVETFSSMLTRECRTRKFSSPRKAARQPWYPALVSKVAQKYYNTIDALVEQDAKRDWNAEREKLGFTMLPVAWRVWPYATKLKQGDALLVVLQAYGRVFHEHVYRDTMAPYDGLSMPTPHKTKLDAVFWKSKPQYGVRVSPIAREVDV